MLARAGQRAASLAAAAEARRYFTQAAELAADPSERSGAARTGGRDGAQSRRSRRGARVARGVDRPLRAAGRHARGCPRARPARRPRLVHRPARQSARQDGAGVLRHLGRRARRGSRDCSRRGCLARTGSAETWSVRPSGPSSLSTSPSPMPTHSPSPWRCAARRRSSSAGATPQEANALLRQALRIAVDNDLAEDAARRVLPALRRTLPVETSTRRRSATSTRCSPSPARWVTGRRSGRRCPNAPTRSSCSAAGTRLEQAARSSHPNRSSPAA